MGLKILVVIFGKKVISRICSSFFLLFLLRLMACTGLLFLKNRLYGRRLRLVSGGYFGSELTLIPALDDDAVFIDF